MSSFPAASSGQSTALVCRNPALRSLSSVLQVLAELAGRILLTVLFLVSGFEKIGSYSQVAAYMASAGVPAVLLPLVIALEIAGSVAIVLGWRTRIAAFVLAGFTLVAAFVFHANFADLVETLMFLKNLAITGGFLLLAAHGAGPLSVDRLRGRS